MLSADHFTLSLVELPVTVYDEGMVVEPISLTEKDAPLTTTESTLYPAAGVTVNV